MSSPAPPPLSGSRACRPRCAGPRPIRTPTPSSGSPISSRCARRAIRPSIRGPRAHSSRPCGSIQRTSPPPAASAPSPWPGTTSAGHSRSASGRARINPDVARNYGVIADAQVELGRYGAAARTLQHYVDVKPELSSYARVSYFRELHGDLPGALGAMRLAVTAGGGTAENVSYVQALVGKLHFDSGDYGGAEAAYRTALETDPGFPAATAGLARVEAARGEYEPAIRRLRGLVLRLPLPEYVIALGETEQAAGSTVAAGRDYRLVGAETRLLQANGVNTDAELAVFEADHGDPAQAVDLAARAWAAAPSVRSADSYSWALSAAGRDGEALRMSERAMRLGSRDPSFLYHAGMVALRAGRRRAGERIPLAARRTEPELQPPLRPAGATGPGGAAMSPGRRPRWRARRRGLCRSDRHAASRRCRGPSARQLHRQPPEPGAHLAGIGGDPLHPRPGGDSDLSGDPALRPEWRMEPSRARSGGPCSSGS